MSNLTIEQQADFIESLVSRCAMRDGTIAAETSMLITRDDADMLDKLANRLRRIAPHEERIRRMVQG